MITLMTDSFPLIENSNVISTTSLLLRLVIGIAFLLHGSQKVFGWFDGPGLDKWGEYLSSKKYPTFVAKSAAVIEMIAGFLLIIGAFTKLSALSMIVFMLFAIMIAHLDKGYFAQKGGYEYQMLLIVCCVVVIMLGGGKYSVDRYLFN